MKVRLLLNNLEDKIDEAIRGVEKVKKEKESAEEDWLAKE